MNSIVFALVVNIPTILLVALSFVANIPGEYGRRALVSYASIMVVAFGMLASEALASPVTAYAAILAGFAAAAIAGPWGLLIAAVALAVLTVVCFNSTAIAVWGPAIAFAGCVIVFAYSRISGRF
jgi:hypothetical protein